MNERIKHIVECALKEDVTQFAESAKAEIFERIDALKASIVSEAVERLGQEVSITESKKSCKCEEDEEPKKEEDDELVEPEKGDEGEDKKEDESSDESDADEEKEKESDDEDDDDDDKDDEKDED